MRVEYVHPRLFEDAADFPCTFDQVEKSVHRHGVHREARFPQPFRQLGVRLANRLKVVPLLTHRHHFLENSVFLPTHAGGGL